MKKILMLTAFLFSNIIYSQKGKIFIETNYNTYTHSKLSSFQNELASDVNSQIPIATTDHFPNNIGFTVGYEFTNIKTSFFLSYNSTGGKLSYADYSGIIRLEQPLDAITLGGMYHLVLDEKETFKIGFKAFTMFSNLEIKSHYQIGDNITKEHLKFSSTDIGLGTSLIYEYPISFFIIRANIGFDLVLGGKLTFDNIKDAHLINKSGEEVKTGWTGFRSGLGIAIPIK